MIERSSIRINGLLDLIGDLLDLSRIEIGKMSDEFAAVSLAEVLEVCLQDARNLAEEKQIEFNGEITSDLPPVYGSVNRLQQLFCNLLSNAVKFTPEGGVVNLKLCEKGGKILGTVRDTGIGIPYDDIAFVFKDFYRASNVEKGTGTGLGLSIVRMIVEAHNGDIWVESPCTETGKGSEFFVALPIALSSPVGAKKSTRGSKVSG
jgi:signal transduction histidine kinase